MEISNNSNITKEEILHLLEASSSAVGIRLCTSDPTSSAITNSKINHTEINLSISNDTYEDEEFDDEFYDEFNDEYYCNDDYYIKPQVKVEQDLYCFCKKNKGQKQLSLRCPYCGNGFYKSVPIINTKAFVQKYNSIGEKLYKFYEKQGQRKYFSKETASGKITVYNNFYVCGHPDYTQGIIIKKINITAQENKTGNDIILTGKCERYIEIIPGVRCKAYKNKRSGTEEMDLFEAFNLSTNINRNNISITYDDAIGPLDFMKKHPDFAKMTAFVEVLDYADFDFYNNVFFMLYMYMYSQYPVIELLAKMGYSTLVVSAINEIKCSYNRDDMQERAERLAKIFNPHSTCGKTALNIPKYMGDYLNSVGADFRVFETWSDIYEYEALSKDNFEKIVKSDEFAEVFRYLDSIANLLKYGYKLEKLIKYIVKQTTVINRPVSQVIGLLRDYHQLIELMEAEFAEYPANIEDVHDKAATVYRAKKDALIDARLTKISEAASSYIPENDFLTIIVPKTTTDFINEGNRQHNCVASYVSRVSSGSTLVFFIRRKDDPNKNYITAEYCSGRLVQIMEKNNFETRNPIAIEYAKEFCKKLSTDPKFRRM